VAVKLFLFGPVYTVNVYSPSFFRVGSAARTMLVRAATFNESDIDDCHFRKAMSSRLYGGNRL